MELIDQYKNYKVNQKVENHNNGYIGVTRRSGLISINLNIKLNYA